ncbi:MAG: phenylalanine--tRNA ligase subunit beta, partial [Gemmatimonas sp.]
MIVSHEWLKQFVPHTLTAHEVGDLLSRHCVTLDSIESTGADLSAFVVAQVVQAARHPNAERLWITKVDDGSGELLDVVCGAPNVVQGAKYPFARTGTTMPAGITIEKRKIRGETSNGMLCSARELGLGEDHDGILQLDTTAVPGTPLLDVIAAGDTRLDLDVLPNRPDLLSHRGVAREISAITGIEFDEVGQDFDDRFQPGWDLPYVQGPSSAALGEISIRVEDAASCPTYVAVIIRDVKVGPSPEWLQRRLASVGLRSISNVVDATNYVLHGYGQPVHAFDLDKLAGSSIVVRPAHEGEVMLTLDGVERKLDAGTTVICDANRPVALAGVMGGEDTQVTDTTTNVLLEVAHFDPKFVRRVRRAVGLSTDASYRFERGIDSDMLDDVARQAATILMQVAAGRFEGLLIVNRELVADAKCNLHRRLPHVAVRPARVARLLGVAIPADEISRRLEALGCLIESDNDTLMVSPPSWRHDLLLEVDFIEEVARLCGFDALPDDLRPFRPGNAPDHPLHIASRRVRAELVSLGLAEARPMPFTSKGDEGTPRVRNPLADDEPYLRASLMDSLAARAEYNLSRMQGNIRLFEVGNAFLPSGERLPREELRAAALVMGARRPGHFTEAQPPAFDRWDAKHIADRMASAAFGGRRVTMDAAHDGTLWHIQVDGIGVVGN